MSGVRVNVQDIPRITFIWSFRTILLIIGETLAAYRIGKVDQWDQIFSDGTGRHHNALQNLSVGVIDEERLHPLILSTSIIMKGDISKQKVDSVLSTIAVCGKRSQRWAEVLKHSHSSYHHYIPDPSSMNICKLGSGGALTSDTCNGVRKTSGPSYCWASEWDCGSFAQRQLWWHPFFRGWFM